MKRIFIATITVDAVLGTSNDDLQALLACVLESGTMIEAIDEAVHRYRRPNSAPTTMHVIGRVDGADMKESG